MLNYDYLKAVIVTSLLILGLFVCFARADAYSEDEIVAKVISAEACGEGKIGMYLVANVIANRAKAWNKTPYQIVTAKNQFYGYTATNRDMIYNHSACRDYSDELAFNLLNLDDITQGALYFRQKTEPLYSWHGKETVRYKSHIFHKERSK